jgi:hypothetical protein
VCQVNIVPDYLLVSKGRSALFSSKINFMLVTVTVTIIPRSVCLFELTHKLYILKGLPVDITLFLVGHFLFATQFKYTVNYICIYICTTCITKSYNVQQNTAYGGHFTIISSNLIVCFNCVMIVPDYLLVSKGRSALFSSKINLMLVTVTVTIIPRSVCLFELTKNADI